MRCLVRTAPVLLAFALIGCGQDKGAPQGALKGDVKIQVSGMT